MTKKDIGIKIIVEVSRVLLGVTFMLSGFVKAVDPFGTAYKIDDYFTAFGMPSLTFMSLPLSALQSIAEFAMGACMLFGLYRKWNSRLTFVVMVFMTILTFYLAIANPVEDCGCFGDFLIISNWQTFYKNIVLLACSFVVLFYHEKISNLFTGKTYWLAFLYIFIFISLFTFRNYILDPLFDFRPYRIGANIKELKDVEVGKGREEQTLLVYAKDGVEKEFTEDNYPWEDSTWVYVRMDTKVIKEGVQSPIKDFEITKLNLDSQRDSIVDTQSITDEVLSDSNYVFLMISPYLNQMSDSYLSSFEDVENYATDNGYKFYCLTASPTDEIIKWAKENVINFDFCTVDNRALKTIIRSNPGLILIKNGVVVNKWADIRVPDESDLTGSIDQLSYGQQIDEKKADKRHLIYICSVFLLPLLGLKGFDLIFFRRNREQEQQEKEQEEKKE